MLDLRLKRMADTIINYSLEIKPGERVLIESSKNCSEMIKYLVELIATRGAIPMVLLKETDIKRSLIVNGNQKQFELMAKHEASILKDVDVYINMIDSDNSYDMSDIPQEKRNLYQQYYFKPIYFDIIVPKLRWTTVDYPSVAAAQRARMSTENYENYFFEAVNTDYKTLAKAMIPLKTILDTSKRVLIITPTTELSFGISSCNAVICDGKINIPDGEVFIAPDKNSVNGRIKFNIDTRYQGNTFSGVELYFENGKLIKAKADNNNHKLNDIISSDSGSCYIGEFAFGTNPNIKSPTTNILFDEKILGSIHIALGNSHSLSNNGNQSSIHWDIVSMLTNEYGGGQVYLDDVLLQKNGMFIPSDLSDLNVKKLKLKREI